MRKKIAALEYGETILTFRAMRQMFDESLIRKGRFHTRFSYFCLLVNCTLHQRVEPLLCDLRRPLHLVLLKLSNGPEVAQTSALCDDALCEFEGLSERAEFVVRCAAFRAHFRFAWLWQ